MSAQWCKEQEQLLRKMWADGATRDDIARAVSRIGPRRSVDAVMCRSRDLGLSSRVTKRQPNGRYKIITLDGTGIRRRPPLFPDREKPPVIDFGLIERMFREARSCSI